MKWFLLRQNKKAGIFSMASSVLQGRVVSPQCSPGEPFPPNLCQRFSLAASGHLEPVGPSRAACITQSSVSCLAFTSRRSHRSHFATGAGAFAPNPRLSNSLVWCWGSGCAAPSYLGRKKREVLMIQADDAIPSGKKN